MKFVDEAIVKVQAGNGGRGSVSFRREKFVPLGGPDGGDGGSGGSVYLRSEPGINTLADFRITRTYRAQHGQPGGGRDCTGRGGEDLHVAVPLGTVVTDADTEEVIGDLTMPGQGLLVAQGGRGGWGNARFKTSTNRAPRQHGSGSPGERRRRVARMAPIRGRYSVCTKSLENAGCAVSAAGGASTSSAYEVSSRSRARSPSFAIDTRRTSASYSAETTTSSIVVRLPSRRTNPARSSVKVTS